MTLRTISAVEALTALLRQQILDGERPPGHRLREQELADEHGVARHTLRAALRVLEADGLVRIERNRGATVAGLDPDQLRGLFELRTAIEVEAARLALARNGGRLPEPVFTAAGRLAQVGRRRRPPWSALVEGHDALHHAIVAASGSDRLVQAHAALADEQRLFVVQLRPSWSGPRFADEHEALVAAIEAEGEIALRRHLVEGYESLAGPDPTTPVTGS